MTKSKWSIENIEPVCSNCGHYQDRHFITEFVCDNCAYSNFWNSSTEEYVSTDPSMAYLWPAAYRDCYDNGRIAVMQNAMTMWESTPRIILVALALLRSNSWFEKIILASN